MNFYWCKLLIYVVSMIIIVRSVWYTYVKRLSIFLFCFLTHIIFI